LGNSVSHSKQGRRKRGVGNTCWALFAGEEVGEGLVTWCRAAAVAGAQLEPVLGRGRLDLG